MPLDFSGSVCIYFSHESPERRSTPVSLLTVTNYAFSFLQLYSWRSVHLANMASIWGQVRNVLCLLWSLLLMCGQSTGIHEVSQQQEDRRQVGRQAGHARAMPSGAWWRNGHIIKTQQSRIRAGVVQSHIMGLGPPRWSALHLMHVCGL